MTKKYSEEHVWVDVRKGRASVGISPYAAEELGELTFVELPEKGTELSQGDVLCVVESTKAASDVICPISGTVAEVNTELEDKPTLVNASPESDGWICKLSDVDETELDSLLSEEEYDDFIEGEDDI